MVHMTKEFEKNISNVTLEDLVFIREYMQLPTEKKILIKGIVIGVNLDEENQTGNLQMT